MDAQGRFEDAPGRPCDGSGLPKSRPRSDLGTPRACQERQGTAQKGPWTGFQTLPDRPGAVSKRVWSSERCRTRPRNDFCRFCVVARKPRYAFRISFYSVLLAFNEVSSQRVHAAKNIAILGISASQIEPGSVRATQNRARAAQFKCQNSKNTHEIKRFLFRGVRTSPVGTRKCAAEVQ